ncbi:uncharacterized protein LOC142221545 [Haematobia irritans]|uniref:uncharacterized protein LOC142221545 n=1 Tax=Haematobia irritans TaxID=7368 RepID=UPI003F504171
MKVIKYYCCLINLFRLLVDIEAVKILAIFPFPGPSQYILVQPYLKALASRGHQLTVINAFPQKQKVDNFRDIPVLEVHDNYADLISGAAEERNKWDEMTFYTQFFTNITETVLKNSKFQDLLQNEKFDLVILEALHTDALYSLARHFGAPMIGVSSFGTDPIIDELMGNMSPLAYIPQVTIGYTDRMSYKERLHNALCVLLELLHVRVIHLPRHRQLLEKYMPHIAEDVWQLRTNFSLMLLNQHFSVNIPRPYVPSMIEVGGFQIQHKPNPLPKAVQEFIDSSQEDVIYFSMGSNVKSKDFPPELREMILETFRSLPYKILWKFEDPHLPGKPENVFIHSWFPQPDVLAHPRVKLFISHGGLLSTTESVYHGKPMLGLPVFYDQMMNVRKAQEFGFALSLNFHSMTRDEFERKIKEMMTNSRYFNRAQKISRIYHDQPMKPLDLAIYWTEYVIRHRGAAHLQAPSQQMNFLQKHSIDTVGVLIAALILVLFILVSIIFKIWKIVVGNAMRKEKILCIWSVSPYCPARISVYMQAVISRVFKLLSLSSAVFLTCKLSGVTPISTSKVTVAVVLIAPFLRMPRNYVVILLIIISNISPIIYGAKILSIFGFPGPSQYIFITPLLKALAERGHEVVSISTFPQKEPIKNFRDIAVMENSQLYDKITSNFAKGNKKSFIEEIVDLGKSGEYMATNVLENPQVKKLMTSETFDLIILEIFYSEALLGLGEHFNAPIVAVSTFGTVNFMDDMVGNPSPLSYIPHMALPYGNRMTLKERITNVLVQAMDNLSFQYLLLPYQERIYKKYFAKATLSLEKARRNVSLVLLNDHFSLRAPRPYVPNMIEVGGLHINPHPDPLPKDLQTLLDKSQEGVIYFSLGSNVKSKDLSPEVQEIFLQTFKELKVTVLWKFENDKMPQKPDNVIIRKWFPQHSILAHPNIKLFISQGGFLSTAETIYFGKPVLGIPFLGDQFMNVKYARKSGYALSLSLDEITKDSLKSSIMELWQNPSYTQNVQKLSKIFRDTPLSPLETSIYWIDYVLRHKGCPHMHVAGNDLGFIQYHNIDVFLILAMGSILIIFMIMIIVRKIKYLCFVKPNMKENTINKSKTKLS